MWNLYPDRWLAPQEFWDFDGRPCKSPSLTILEAGRRHDFVASLQSIGGGNKQRNTVEDRGLRAWWSRSERKVVPYVFISPFYILFIVFSVGPLIYALYLSLHRWPGSGPMRHVGLGNYTYLAGDPVFLKSLWNTVYYAVGAFLFILPLALCLALLINSTLIRLKSLFRIGYFLPILTSTVAATIMFLLIFNNQFGLDQPGLGAAGHPGA